MSDPMNHKELAEELLRHGDDMQAFVAALGHAVMALVDQLAADE